MDQGRLHHLDTAQHRLFLLPQLVLGHPLEVLMGLTVRLRILIHQAEDILLTVIGTTLQHYLPQAVATGVRDMAPVVHQIVAFPGLVVPQGTLMEVPGMDQVADRVTEEAVVAINQEDILAMGRLMVEEVAVATEIVNQEDFGEF